MEYPQTAPPGYAIVYYEDVLLSTTLLKHAKLMIYVASVLYTPVASILIILLVNLSKVAVFFIWITIQKTIQVSTSILYLGRPVSVFLPPGKISFGGPQLI